MHVVCDLEVTLPPSINLGWKLGKGRAFKSREYIAAQKAILAEVLEGRSKGTVARGKHEGLMVVAVVHSAVNPGDVDNRTKAVIDCLARAEVFANDSQSIGGIYAVSENIPEHRARVVILGVPDPERPEGVKKSDWGKRRQRGVASKSRNITALLGMLESRGVL